MAARDIDPRECSFELFAIGPLFEEQGNMESHKPIRNIVAALEKALADWLRDRGYKILGTHQGAHPVDPGLFCRVAEIIDRHFPPVDQPSQ